MEDPWVSWIKARIMPHAINVLLSWVPTVTLVVCFAALIIVVATASTWQMLKFTR